MSRSNGGPGIFGPDWWRGDAFVTGYSRGKIYRTKLVKTGAGYVAQNQLIAALDMLPSDVCVTPERRFARERSQRKTGLGQRAHWRREKFTKFLTATETRRNQWRSGRRARPKRVLNSIARSIPRRLKNLAKQITITQGKYVSAGDQFETIRPGYQAVQNQLLQPRYAVKVLSTELTADGRSLVIRTEPRVEAVNYAITIPQRKTDAQK